jgi:drug/metabolite transporter (DMT)-like permease
MDQTENGNLRGIVLMVVSMAAFAIEDSFIKRAADDMPTGQILLMLGVFGAAIFTVMAARAGQKPFSRDLLQGQVMLRNLGEVIGTMGFITAIALTPLTSATAILQAMPLAVTLGAALFLGESVGWRRWTAILVGFAGVLVIIRPGLEGFDINSLWAVLAVFGLAIRDLATRRVPARIGSMSISVSGFVSVAILGAAMLALSGGAVWPGT